MYKFTLDNNQFLQLDSGHESEDRFLFFLTNYNSRILYNATI